MKTHITCSLFLAMLWLTLPSGVQAQENKNLSERVQQLEKKLVALPQISGLINVRYQYDDVKEAGSFDLRRARLDFRGTFSPSLDYRLQLDMAGSPKVLDAYLRWKIDPGFNLQFGEFKIPFSIENPYSPMNLEVIENSVVITRLSGYTDVSTIRSNGRDIGIGLYGSFLAREGFNIVNYSIGLFNGNGINTTDNNKSKDFSGILTVNPLKTLALAAFHYNGSTTVGDNTDQRVRSGAGAKYEDARLLVRSEYITGKTGSMESDGYYAVVGYKVTPKLQPIVKFDSFQEDTDNKDTREKHYLLGLNYMPIKNVRVAMNYAYRELTPSNQNWLGVQLYVTF